MDSLFPNLSAVMDERGVSIGNLADAIGLSEEVVSLKMKGIKEWTLLEALAVCRYLRCFDFKTLFLR